MTAKEFVLQHKPTVKAERQSTREIMGRRSYWLIREKDQYMYFSQGKTQGQAWANAKRRIQGKETLE